MNPVSVSVRYGGYGGYRYRFGIEDMDMGDVGTGISVSYRFFNVISVSKNIRRASRTYEPYSPGTGLGAWDRSLGVEGRSQSINYSGTGPRIFFDISFLIL